MSPNGFGHNGEDDLRRAIDGFRHWLGRSRKRLVTILAALAVVVALVGSYYQVEAEEVGLVTRFGRFVRISNPGAHGKLPFGIEQVQKVPVEPAA